MDSFTLTRLLVILISLILSIGLAVPIGWLISHIYGFHSEWIFRVLTLVFYIYFINIIDIIEE